MTPWRKRPVRRGGYSLVELLVAATFLTIGLVGSLMVHTAARGLRRTAVETREATVALGNVMEEMRALTRAQVLAQFPDGAAIPVDDTALRNLVLIPDFRGFAIGDQTLEIELTATWTAFNRRARSFSFESAL
ncbi:MAG: hypothetical protein WD226_01385 [Planctomycetota bacterium]